MVIGVTGYGATGASACIDLIKEFQGIQSFRASFEFQLLQQTDGIVDLKYSLVKSGRRLDSNAAITRFLRNLDNPRAYHIIKETNGRYKELSHEYIKKISIVQWSGKSFYDPIDLHFPFDRLWNRNMTHAIEKGMLYINKNWTWPPQSKRYFALLSEEEFDSATKDYLGNILLSCGFDKDRPVLLEQVFSTSNPLDGAEYFDDVRSIIIDRDPRDLYIICNYLYPDLSLFMPHEKDVHKFVMYYKKMHRPKILDPRVLYIQFEDLIFQYEEMIVKLKAFLGLKNHIHKGECFKPDFSINNTRLFKKRPDLSKDIAYIEHELPEFIYPFEEMHDKLSFRPKNANPFIVQHKAKEISF